MAEALTIRRLVAADLPAYKALRDEMLAAHPEAFTSDAAAERSKPASAYAERLGVDGPGDADPAFFAFGAFVGERLVGAFACERDGRAKVRHVGRLIGMMVRAEVRRAGIGRALLDACVEEARRVGALEMLTLSVTATNADAVRLYRRGGFVRYGTLPHAIRVDGRYHDKDLMVRTL